MKCIQSKNTGKILRVTNQRAFELVDLGTNYKYTSKSNYKKQNNNVKKIN